MALPTNITVATELLSDVHANSVRKFGRIRTFRDVALGAVSHPRTAARLYKEAYALPDALNLLPSPPPPDSEIYTEPGRDPGSSRQARYCQGLGARLFVQLSEKGRRANRRKIVRSFIKHTSLAETLRRT